MFCGCNAELFYVANSFLFLTIACQDELNYKSPDNHTRTVLQCSLLFKVVMDGYLTYFVIYLGWISIRSKLF